MKTIEISPKQKKWALTVGLLAVLGFNMSTPIQGGLQSLELASESDEDAAKSQTLISNDGRDEVRVEYLRHGEKTIAVVHGSLEGGSCEASGCLSSKVLNLPFESSATELERALRAASQEVGARPQPPRDQEIVEEEDAFAQSTTHLDRVLRQCARRDEGRERATCLTREYIRALKDKRRKIDPDAALEFFRDEIRPQLLATMTSEDLQSISMGSAALGLYGGNGIQGADLIRKLQAELPREYNDVRKAAKDVAVEVVNHYAAAAKQAAQQATEMRNQSNQYKQMANQAMQQANQTQDPHMKAQLMQQAQQYQNLAFQQDQQGLSLLQQSQQNAGHLERILVQGLGQQQAAGLQEAFSAKLVDQVFASQLNMDYQAKAIQALANPTLPNLLPPNGGNPSPVPNAPSVPGRGQQYDYGNGMGVIGIGTGNNGMPMERVEPPMSRQSDQGFRM